MIATLFLVSSLVAAFCRYDINSFRRDSLFYTGSIIAIMIILSTIYFFSYKIIVTDNDFISVRHFLKSRRIYYKDIVSLRSSGLNGHIKKIKDGNTTIRVAINDAINKPYELVFCKTQTI